GGPEERPEHPRPVLQAADLARWLALPVDGPRRHAPAAATRTQQQLDVEAKTRDGHPREQVRGRRGGEGLEPALRIFNTAKAEPFREGVEETPRGHAVAARSHHDAGGGHGPRADGDVGAGGKGGLPPLEL